jgi:hypothetical protein
MSARELEAIAKRWERQSPAPPPDRRSTLDRRMDALFERVRAQSGAACLPCLLEELE